MGVEKPNMRVLREQMMRLSEGEESENGDNSDEEGHEEGDERELDQISWLNHAQLKGLR
jgi:hypothetical protein